MTKHEKNNARIEVLHQLLDTIGKLMPFEQWCKAENAIEEIRKELECLNDYRWVERDAKND